MSSVRRAPCPQCGEPATLSPENLYRPFCSERCKMLDLGAWVSGRYVIPGEPVQPAEDDVDREGW